MSPPDRSCHPTNKYLLGDSNREFERLETQSQFYADMTGNFLVAMALEPGMRVLDIGCGAGDVTMLLARRVGPSGQVVGVDQSSSALATASRRCLAAGLHNVSFVNSDLATFEAAEQFDALVGRFILLHAPNPAALLKQLLRHVTRGGLIGIQEMDVESISTTPKLELMHHCIEAIAATYRRAGLQPNMGSRLMSVFLASGLPQPKMIGNSRVEGGVHSVFYDYVAETIQSFAPAMDSLGVPRSDELRGDTRTLAELLRHEAIASSSCIVAPRLIGAWSRLTET